MYPGIHARRRPDHPAVIMAGSGVVVTHGELDARSNRIAQLLYRRGLRPGDGVAFLMENTHTFYECYWAVIRSGLYLTAINTHLSAEEAAYIVNDSGADVLITSSAMADLASGILPLLDDCSTRLMVHGAHPGFEDLEALAAECPEEPLAEEVRGETMLYSSGTTGRPKGIRRPLSGVPLDAVAGNTGLVASLWGMGPDARYLSPAPLYHAAPLGFTTAVQAWGGTAVVMEKFDPTEAIACIDRYQITHSQWVPTMFVRMLKLDEAIRSRLDGTSHRVAIHAAAPCPAEVKRAMIDWWGPILHEYYAGTEMNGFVQCNSEEWLARPGTVGTAILGTLHICDDEGNELPPGESGLVYFERDTVPFQYHNDAAKTRSAQHPTHPTWTALGDIGYVDDDGYLFLTDRKAFMIISGGVNIYPQEIENALVVHPKVSDVAVFGIPHAEMGEQVHAVVQPAEGVVADELLAEELTTWLRDRLASYKVPRSIEFRDELPRSPTGKLYKQALQAEYLPDATGNKGV